MKEIEHSSGLPLNVPDRLTKPDILITCTQNYLDAVRRYTWSSGGKYPSRSNVLNIDVSKDHLPRALRFMNAIIALLRARGHSFLVKDNHTLAVVYGEEIMIRLRERHKRVASKEKYQNWESIPTGKLVFKNIFWSAIRFNQAGFLRNYVKKVETNAKKSGAYTEEKQQWIAWARETIDWYDPLVNKENQLLVDFNKNTLMKELLTGQDEKGAVAPWMPSHYF